MSKEPRRPSRLSEELLSLADRLGQRPVSLREVVGVLQGRAYTVLLLVLSLPFCTPIPLPGLSTPFGLVIAMIGLRLSLRKTPWLPQRLLDTSLPPLFLSALLRASRRILRLLEWGLRPRWGFLVEDGILHHVWGLLILVSGLLLLLPLPIPFSNFLPAMVVVLTAGALLERDGLCAMAAGTFFILELAFFTAIAWGGAEVMAWLKHWIGTWGGQ